VQPIVEQLANQESYDHSCRNDESDLRITRPYDGSALLVTLILVRHADKPTIPTPLMSKMRRAIVAFFVSRELTPRLHFPEWNFAVGLAARGLTCCTHDGIIEMRGGAVW
jgi:hypothetical protein